MKKGASHGRVLSNRLISAKANNKSLLSTSKVGPWGSGGHSSISGHQPKTLLPSTFLSPPSKLRPGRGANPFWFSGITRQRHAIRTYHSSTILATRITLPTLSHAKEEREGATAGQLFRYLKETAEAGDKEAQFRVGCMLCLGEDALRANVTTAVEEGEGGVVLEIDEDEADAAALLQLEQLDFILGDEGWVVPKEKETFEKTKITNWRQWLKREREKLKNRKLTQADASAKEEDKVSVDYPQAAKWFQLSAQQGHPLAQYFLGMFYLKGLGVEYNLDAALDLLTKSAKQGNSLSCYDLGQLYYEGTKVPRDVKLSRDYFQRSVDLGNANAMYWFGYCYHEGIDCEPSMDNALALLGLAAERRHPGAIFYLAMMYRTGAGVSVEIEKMMDYLKLGADEAEDPESMRCLAETYYYGDGVDVDYPRALHYYHQAGLRGDADALCCEGVMHFKGQGTEQDYTRAFYAYQASALKDNPAACRNLSHMYRNGLGCAKSEVNADFYLARSEEIIRKQQEAHTHHHHHHHGDGGCCNHDHDHDHDHGHDHDHDHEHCDKT